MAHLSQLVEGADEDKAIKTLVTAAPEVTSQPDEVPHLREAHEAIESAVSAARFASRLVDVSKYLQSIITAGRTLAERFEQLALP